MTRAIPEGYHTVTPYLVVPDVRRLLRFLEEAFDARPAYPPMEQPDGRIMHAEVRLGDSRVMMGEPNEQFPAMPAMINLYLEDVDEAYRRALAAGAESVRAPEDQFYGDRSGGVRDFAGNLWWISTRVEDVSPEEARRRMEAGAGRASGD